MENILPVDTFIVVNKTILNHDNKVLISLYQPLIGSTAISLYYTLSNYLDYFEYISDEVEHHSILNNMMISINEFNDARKKLEAIGLIKTFQKKGKINSYIYEIYSPISADEFLNNPIFSVSLLTALGQYEYNKIVEMFKIPAIEFKNYENISTHFKDVFEYSNNYSREINIENIRKTNTNSIELKTIDINELLALIPDEMLMKKSITKTDVELINKLSYVYNYDINIMVELIRNSINEKHRIDKDLLKENASKYYQFDNGKLPSLIYKNQPKNLCSNKTEISSKNRLINIFENTSPYDFIASKYKTGIPSKSDLSIISYLLIDLELNPGVVNVLVDYVLKINNNKLIKSFVDVIASQWKKSNIITVEDAMNIAFIEYHKRNNKKVPSKVEKTKTLPKWIENDIKENKATEEEIEELERMLREV